MFGLSRDSLPPMGHETETGMSAETRLIVKPDAPERAQQLAYLDSLALVERLHRLLLDVIKDEFERLGVLEINPVQALLLFNIGEHEVTAGELKTRGYYQGSNVSYNLKKLVELGYMHHQRSEIDRRSVRVRLTEKGRRVRTTLSDLFARQADQLEKRGMIGPQAMDDINTSLRRMERFWTEQIRYIY
jgi:DNA-binding MarR family transcriptional regulator